MGDEGAKFEEVYGDLGDNYSCGEYSSFISYSVYDYNDEGYIYIYAYADPETGLIDDYSYKFEKDSID